jgi:hypothetical protein
MGCQQQLHRLEAAQTSNWIEQLVVMVVRKYFLLKDCYIELPFADLAIKKGKRAGYCALRCISRIELAKMS